MKSFITKQSVIVGIGFLILGLLLGGLFFGSESNKHEVGPAESGTHDHTMSDASAEETWTCSMHPQVRKDEPGQCPICGMDLIPVTNTSSESNSEVAVQMTAAAAQIANIQTVPVQRAEPVKEIYLSGRVEADERNIAEITARFAGRIEKLYVNFTGQPVKRGQALASVYSPALITAQKELFEAARFRESNPSFYEAAVNKLKLWDLSDRQIQNIMESGEVRYNFNILAPHSGTVVTRNVSAGDYVQEGQSLFEVANLDQVWVVFDAYESDLPWVQEGGEIRFTVQSLPGQSFTSEVAFIDPVINPEKRVAEVRTEVKNQSGKLKPQMFVQGILESQLPQAENQLVIPKSAVLWTGKRAVVYVKQAQVKQPTFAYREVVLGPEAGGQYIVSEGLTEGEEVVVNGVFKVDAAAQLQGKVSMMNPGGDAASTGHDRGAMEMENEDSRMESRQSEQTQEVSAQFQQQLSAILEPYLNLKNALVASNAEQAATTAEQTEQALAKVDMTLVQGPAHQQWMEYLRAMQEALGTITESAALDDQRTAFAPLSTAFYQSLKQFNVTGLNIYYQYCPMAERDEGAYWLSELEEINNPYFGEAMLRCGETRETLE